MKCTSLKLIIALLISASSGYAETFRYPAVQAGKIGFIDERGTVQIPFKYELVGQFREGFALVYTGGDPEFIDTNGKFVLRIQRSDVYSVDQTVFSHGFVLLGFYPGCYYADITGTDLFRQRFVACGHFSNGIAGVRLKLEHTDYGLLNLHGQLTAIKAQCLWNFHENLSAFQQDDKLGFIAGDGKIVIPPSFGPLGGADNCFDDRYRFSEGLAMVPQKGKAGFIDQTGRFVINPTFAYASNFSEGLAVVKLTEASKEYVYIDHKGATVLKIAAVAAHPFAGGLARVVISVHEVIWINKSGVPVVRLSSPGGHVSAGDFVGPLAFYRVQTVGRLESGYIDKSGKKVFSWAR